MKRAARPGITLVEMMVVIAIIFLILTLAFPAIQIARDSARRLKCNNNMWQIGMAMAQYENVFGVFPPATLGCDGMCSENRNGKSNACKQCPKRTDESMESDSSRMIASAFVLILPYAEQESLYKLASIETTGLWRVPRFRSELWTSWQTPQALQFISTRPSLYVCPSDPSEPLFEHESSYGDVKVAPATGSYAVCGGTKGPRRPLTVFKCNNDGMFVMARPRTTAEVTDGLSNTFLVGEVLASDSVASSNVWSLATRLLDSWRVTENALNSRPAVERLPGPGISCYPEDAENCANGAFGSNHFWGANFLFADGHVAYMRDKVK